MNMLCLGWRTITTCGGTENAYGRNQQVVPPTGGDGQTCPSAAWFYIGAAVVAGMILARR